MSDERPATNFVCSVQKAGQLSYHVEGPPRPYSEKHKLMPTRFDIEFLAGTSSPSHAVRAKRSSRGRYSARSCVGTGDRGNRPVTDGDILITDGTGMGITVDPVVDGRPGWRAVRSDESLPRRHCSARQHCGVPATQIDPLSVAARLIGKWTKESGSSELSAGSPGLPSPRS